MKAPTCPEHGNLVLDLARGRLNDADAVEADVQREKCQHCAEWWSTTFADFATSQVDAAVKEAFAGFSPAAGRRRVWLAVAAAAVLAVVVGTTTMVWRGSETAPIVAKHSTAGEAVLSTWDFEDGTLTPTTAAAVVPTPGSRADAGEAVFVNDLESGDLASWTFHS
jgi:anti-sigma-K factor RskA